MKRKELIAAMTSLYDLHYLGDFFSESSRQSYTFGDKPDAEHRTFLVTVLSNEWVYSIEMILDVDHWKSFKQLITSQVICNSILEFDKFKDHFEITINFKGTRSMACHYTKLAPILAYAKKG